ncbi:M20/M25/M40 family metallo-hydrolase [Novosphingobium sp. 9]|uniref:M20/M25/M40 family metallo-hydrolase n=1 Tax=Novosphingobium sp. 9 TaxID=2025349 RepID=UPI0021B54501|nr:M20/M25/M40 family metallo-hydrolase [Novosphingobium sp. 9]
MLSRLSLLAATLIASTTLAGGAQAASSHAAADAQALDLAKKAIAIRSVEGPDNKTIDADNLFRDALIAGGWAASDIEVVPVDDTAYMIATWKGSDPSLKPLVISGHLDVVAANPKDWERDPFTPVVENGYLFGRGASDMKTSAAVTAAALIDLRKSGYKPRRTIILEFSGDEETSMKTSAIIAKKLSNANLVINIDGGGGMLDEKTGKPLFWNWDGAEKTYNDYTLTVTNPGGHSSMPRPVNAIVEMAQALERIGAYRFAPEQNAITKAYFENAAKFEPDAKTAAAMKAIAANPNDEAALAVLRAEPENVGKVSTTCVATMVNGGHALNALPQSVTANINCRIFPGHTREEIMAELQKVVADPAIKVTDATGDFSVASPASPMRKDFTAAVDKAMAKAWPNVAIFPVQASGASDSMWFRALGVDSYGASPFFIKASDDFSHGLNERLPLVDITPGVTYFLTLIPELSK